MRDKQVRSTVVIVIRGVCAHAGFRVPVLAQGDSGRYGNFVELPVAPIHEQEVVHRVIRYEDIGPAVTVEVESQDSQSVAGFGPDAGLQADVLEAAVAVVAVKLR